MFSSTFRLVAVVFKVLLYSTSMVGFVRVICGEIEIDIVAYDLFLVMSCIRVLHKISMSSIAIFVVVIIRVSTILGTDIMLVYVC